MAVTQQTPSNNKNGQSKPIGQATTNKPLDSSKELIIEQVIVNIFFDGTKNNMYNTDAYDKNKHDGNSDYESYTNAYTNVAHLFKGRQIDSKDIWIYIDGIGTQRLGEDDKDGFAFGNGRTGITDRASFAFNEVANKFIEKHGINSRPNILKLNVFGFSRGSATARHFVHLANIQHYRFFGLPKNNVKVNFVGIFDTVSSFQPNRTGKHLAGSLEVLFKGSDFNNDVEELHLNFSKGYADKVFHIAAADEYRIFFH